MKIAALLAVVALAACADSPEPVRGDLATFDGQWNRGAHCTSLVGGRCDLPPWHLDAGRGAVSMAVIEWRDHNDATLATHRGDVLDGCLSVPAGMDGDLARDAYDLCPVDGATPREIRGVIVWGRGTVGECHCDSTLRLQP